MSKKFLAALAVLCILSLAGCSKYQSGYMAVGFVHSNTSRSGTMSFFSFNGTHVLNMRCGDQDAGQIRYSAKLGSGSASVYYDCGEGKTLLFAVRGGDNLQGSGGQLKEGAVYIVVETDGACEDGEFRFEIE